MTAQERLEAFARVSALPKARAFSFVQRKIDLVVEQALPRPADVDAVGDNRLVELLEHCRETVPAYATVSPRGVLNAHEWLADFSVISKQLLLANFLQHISRAVSFDPLSLAFTGGTSYQAAHLKSYTEDLAIDRALRGRFLKDLEVPQGSECVDLAPRRYLNGERLEPLCALETQYGAQLCWRLGRYVADDQEREFEYSVLRLRNIASLHGAPSRLYGLVDYCRRNDVTLKNLPISFSFEHMSHNLRHVLERELGAVVRSLYATVELGVIGWECARGQIHVEEDFSVVEALDTAGCRVPDGTTGRMVVTSLKSRVMPMIRYDTGDLGVLARGVCECGRAGVRVERLEGRQGGMFVSQGGQFIPPFVIVEALDLAGMYEYQVVQIARGAPLEVHITEGNSANIDDVKRRLAHESKTKNAVALFTYEFKRVRDFRYTKTGKRHLYLCSDSFDDGLKGGFSRN